MMQLQIFSGHCEQVELLGNRLATIINKTENNTPLYVALCQQGDKKLRQAAIQEISSWPDHDFSNPDNPALTYGYDVLILMVEMGAFDEAIQLMNRLTEDNLSDLISIRNHRSEQADMFACDPRAAKLYANPALPAYLNKPDCG